MARLRSKNTVFSSIFSRLREYCNGVPYPIHEKHYPDTSDDEDAIIENTEIITKLNFGDYGILVVKYNGLTYAVTSNINIDTLGNLAPHFTLQPLNNGVWCLAVHYLSLKVNQGIEPTEIYNNALAVPDETDPSKAISVPVNILEEYFGSISLYIINSLNFMDCSPEKTLGYFLCQSGNYDECFNSSCINEFKLLFEGQNQFIPYETVLIAFDSNTKKHSFIELYRCIENLYPLPHFRSFSSQYNLPQINPLDLAHKIEEAIKWRPREDQSLEELLKIVPAANIMKLDGARSSIVNYQDWPNHTFVYKLRNSCVHYRQSLASVIIPENSWDEVLSGMIQVVMYLYSAFNVELAYK